MWQVEKIQANVGAKTKIDDNGLENVLRKYVGHKKCDKKCTVLRKFCKHCITVILYYFVIPRSNILDIYFRDTERGHTLTGPTSTFYSASLKPDMKIGKKKSKE